MVSWRHPVFVQSFVDHQTVHHLHLACDFLHSPCNQLIFHCRNCDPVDHDNAFFQGDLYSGCVQSGGGSQGCVNALHNFAFINIESISFRRGDIKFRPKLVVNPVTVRRRIAGSRIIRCQIMAILRWFSRRRVRFADPDGGVIGHDKSFFVSNELSFAQRCNVPFIGIKTDFLFAPQASNLRLRRMFHDFQLQCLRNRSKSCSESRRSAVPGDWIFG